MSEALERTRWHEFEDGRQAVADFIAETIALLIEERDWYRAAWKDVEGLLKVVQDERDKLVVELCEQKAEYQALMSKYGAREEEIAALNAIINRMDSRIKELWTQIDKLEVQIAQEADHGNEKPATEPTAAGG